MSIAQNRPCPCKSPTPRLLAVDGEHAFRLAVEEFFVPRGWWVDSASDATVAAGLLLMRPYSVVLLGWESGAAHADRNRRVLTAALRQSPPPHVVVIVPATDQTELPELKALGVTAVAEQPVEFAKLEQYLQSLASRGIRVV